MGNNAEDRMSRAFFVAVGLAVATLLVGGFLIATGLKVWL